MAQQVYTEEEDWQKFKESGNEEARQRLAERYLPLVKWVVDRIGYRLPPNIDREDLVGEGILGLLDAIEKFEPDRVSRFESYASLRIRGSVLDFLRRADFAPRTLRRKCREIEKAFSDVERKLGRSAEENEVANVLGITVDEMNTALGDLAGTVVLSFEELLQVSEDEKPIPFIARIKDVTADDPANLVIKQEMRNILIEACDKLPEVEKKVIGLYYVENLTLKEIGEVLNVSESRVCQLHSKALMRLRAVLTEEV
ncbi:MAG: FliA/WhiG family RNA polymerase sigma factor [bacterium]